MPINELPLKSKVKEKPIEELVVLEDLPKDIEEKMLKDIKFLQEHGIKPDDYPGIDLMQSSAYPNYDYGQYKEPPADTRKWLDAARQIFYLTHTGEDRSRALQKVVAHWSDKEKRDFYYWLRFYEEGGHLKYKAGDLEEQGKKALAQLQFFNGNNLGYPMPQQPPATFDQIKVPETHPDVQEDEKRERIELQRKKELSRLDSFEKLLRSHDGHELHGHELERALDAAYQLKKMIMTVNKRASSTRLYEDLIVRQANILTKNGFIKAADMFHKFAQGMPATPEPRNPLQGGGVPGNIPGEGPGMTPEKSIDNNDPAAVFDPNGAAENPTPVGSPTALPMPPPVAGMTQSSPTDNQTPGQGDQLPQAPQPSAGMAAFLKGLEEGGDEFEDEEDEENGEGKEDRDKVSAASLALGLKLQAALVLDHYYGSMVSRAQTAPVVPEAAPPPEPTEINEDPIPEPTPQNDPAAKAGSDFDKVIDSAFQQLTVADVVSKLEDLTKVFRVREIPRQLAIIDVMLDRLGLASFFPSLGECVQKSHESNNYVSTRLEDILSRLRGTLTTKDIDLKGDQPEVAPEAQDIQQKLKQDQDAEIARKRMRKDIANKELEQAAKPKADIEVAEDLGAQPPQVAPALAPAPGV